MARFEIRVSQSEKDAWKTRAAKDGFQELSPWIRWLANLQLKKKK